MSNWSNLVTSTYKKNHAKDPEYKLMDAMKDAKKMYKKKGGATTSKQMKKSCKNRNMRNTRKMRK
jgi:hypothetical protein